MKYVFLSFFILTISIQNTLAQNATFDQNFLFDEEDIIVQAQPETDKKTTPSEKKLNKDINNAVNTAKNILKQNFLEKHKILIYKIPLDKTIIIYYNI